MEQKDKLKILIRFLKKHKAYNQFFAHCFSNNGWSVRKSHPKYKTVTEFIDDEFNHDCSIINKAFIWKETEEGTNKQKETVCSWTERVNTVKMSIFPTHAMDSMQSSLKFQKYFSTEIRQKILRFICNHERPQNSQNNPE